MNTAHENCGGRVVLTEEELLEAEKMARRMSGWGCYNSGHSFSIERPDGSSATFKVLSEANNRFSYRMNGLQCRRDYLLGR